MGLKDLFLASGVAFGCLLNDASRETFFDDEGWLLESVASFRLTLVRADSGLWPMLEDLAVITELFLDFESR